MALCASLLAFGQAARPAHAQDATISDLGASYYQGCKTVEGQLYYMLRQQRNVYDAFNLELYGLDIQKKDSIELRLGRNWYQGGARIVGGAAVCHYFTGKDGMLLTVDTNGQKLKEVHFPADDVYPGQAAIGPAGGGDFYLAYPRDAGKSGFGVARFGPDLAVKWQKDYAPKKGKYLLRFVLADAATRSLTELGKLPELPAYATEPIMASTPASTA